jgi:uncharacterized protein YbcI
MLANDMAVEQQIAQAATEFQTQSIGHAPKAVTVVFSKDTLVITLHQALTLAERALAQSPEGAAQVQELHRQLFESSSGALAQQINRITGRMVKESAAQVEPANGAMLHVFTSGNVVQIFLLAPIDPPSGIA